MTRRGFSSRLAAASISERTGCTQAVGQPAETTGRHPNTSGDPCLAEKYVKTDLTEQELLGTAPCLEEEDIKPDLTKQDAFAHACDWESRWRACDPKIVKPATIRPPHLDSLSPELQDLLEQERDRSGASVRNQLRDYDESDLFRNAQEMFHDCRDDFELEVRGQASKEMHDVIMDTLIKLEPPKRKSHLRGPYDEEMLAPRKEPPIVIIALMAVHITTEGRLEKLSNTLRSIQVQDLSGVNAELHVAVSWYSPEPALAARVQKAFHYFIAARDSAVPRTGCMASVSRSSRISFSSFSAAIEATQKHMGRSEMGSGTVPPFASGGSATVTIRQNERCTQFQHYHAALRAAETELRRRWGLRSDESSRRSVWVIFGDDDDLWHRRRAAEFARAVQTHPDIEGVAVLATLTRAGAGLFEGQDHVPERFLPKTAEHVDGFLRLDGHKVYVGSDHANDDKCIEWQTSLEKDGGSSTDRPPPENLVMEHFDFSPRLRVLQEYFDTTAKDILAHRFCDLRLCEFLGTYPRFGREFGMHLHFFKPRNCWMYFYRNSGVAPEVMKEDTDVANGQEAQDLPEVMNSEVEHVSAEVPITDVEIALGEKWLHEFWEHDTQMTPNRLTKYFANFRTSLEHHIVRLHTRTVDQRRFDGLVFICAISSFGTFVELCTEQGGPSLSCDAGLTLLHVCRLFAIGVADALGVTIFWRDQGSVIVPAFFRVEAVEPAPNTFIDSGPKGCKGLCSSGNSKGLGKGFLSKGKGQEDFTSLGTPNSIPLSSTEDLMEAECRFNFCIPGASL